MLPACSASSTMVIISSSVIFSSELSFRIFATSSFHFVNMKFTGVITTINLSRNGAEAIAKPSGISLAMLFGVISPKTSTTTVMTTVAIVAPYEPKIFTNRIVAIDVIAMLTILLPTSIVVSSLSYFSESFSTRSALRLPSPAIFLSRILLTEVKAVSVAEKYAENITSTIMMSTFLIMSSLIKYDPLLSPAPAMYIRNAGNDILCIIKGILTGTNT